LTILSTLAVLRFRVDDDLDDDFDEDEDFDQDDDESDQEDDESEDGDDPDDDVETWQVGAEMPLKVSLRLTSGIELPRLAPISQLS